MVIVLDFPLEEPGSRARSRSKAATRRRALDSESNQGKATHPKKNSFCPGQSRSLPNDNKFLDDKICTFKILLSWRFPRKTAFWTIFLSAAKAPPPQKAKFLFVLLSRRL